MMTFLWTMLIMMSGVLHVRPHDDDSYDDNLYDDSMESHIGMKCFPSASNSRVQVKVQQGVLEGQVLKTMTGFPYKSFTGIPYAKAPVGNLRFRDPVPAGNWQGVLNATMKSKECSQFDFIITKQLRGVEDALHLNVYVPDSAKNRGKLPVMFWVHGGGYNMGSGSIALYGPEHLVPHNVILVTINYRLGPLGFMCLDIEEAPGNMGLKDQALALKWVNKNIDAFGGDPSKVTIFGESAGASAVHHLILSPLTKGLFKQAILQSGTAVCEWSVPVDPVENAFKLGEALGLKTTNKYKLVKFLKQVPVDKLMTAARQSTKIVHLVFGPVVEKNIPNVTPLCTKDPRKIIEDGDFTSVPAMIGCTTSEGMIMILLLAEELVAAGESLKLETLIPDFKQYVPIHLQRKFDAKRINLAAQKIKEKYFPDEDDLVQKFQVLQHDFAFIKDIDFTAKHYAKKTPVYYYEFGVKSGLNLLQYLQPFPYEGAAHLDDVAYLFTQKLAEFGGGIQDLNVTITDIEILGVRRATELWTNFVKYGNPTPNVSDALPTIWKPMTSSNKFPYLEIGEDLIMKNNPHMETIQFWECLEKL